MSQRLRKTSVIVGLCVVALIASGVAYGYWTASGTGSGTATVAEDAGVTITNVAIERQLYPGLTVPVGFRITNLSNAPVVIDKVAADGPVDGLPAGCHASDFSFPDVVLNKAFVGNEVAAFAGTLAMANTPDNQDACKGASLVLHLKTVTTDS